MAKLTKAQRKDLAGLINALQAANDMWQYASQQNNLDRMIYWRLEGYRVMIELADTHGIELPYLKEAREHLANKWQ